MNVDNSNRCLMRCIKIGENGYLAYIVYLRWLNDCAELDDRYASNPNFDLALNRVLGLSSGCTEADFPKDCFDKYLLSAIKTKYTNVTIKSSIISDNNQLSKLRSRLRALYVKKRYLSFFLSNGCPINQKFNSFPFSVYIDLSHGYNVVANGDQFYSLDDLSVTISDDDANTLLKKWKKIQNSFIQY